jgi:hypothetical protein
MGLALGSLGLLVVIHCTAVPPSDTSSAGLSFGLAVFVASELLNSDSSTGASLEQWRRLIALRIHTSSGSKTFRIIFMTKPLVIKTVVKRMSLAKKS